MARRNLKLAGNLILGLLFATVLFSLYAHAVVGKAWGWNVVQGESMVPTLRRGDVVFVLPYVAGFSSEPRAGEVIVFERRGEGGKPEKVIHRVVKVTSRGFITKGDGNAFEDSGVVRREKLEGIVPQIGGRVFKIPGLGALILYVGSSKLRSSLALGLILILAVWTLAPLAEKRRPQGRGSFPLGRRPSRIRRLYETCPPLFNYLGLVGLTTLIMVSGIVRGVTQREVTYGVSVTGQERIMAGYGEVNFDYIAIGTSKEAVLTVETDAILPVVAYLRHNLGNLELSRRLIPLEGGGSADEVTLLLKTEGVRLGVHSATLEVWVFPRTLPLAVIGALADKHPLAAALAVSIVPSAVAFLPLALLDYAFSERKPKRKRVYPHKAGV